MTEVTQEVKGVKKYAFFIGCTIQVRLPYIERLARDIFRNMGIELVDLDFTCCPTARIVKDVDIMSWLLIAARNIAVAEKEFPGVSFEHIMINGERDYDRFNEVGESSSVRMVLAEGL